jgi:general secretion pathway protein F
MSTFRYRAVDAAGVHSTGLQEAESPRHLRTVLRERGLLPLSVEEIQGSGSAGGHRHGRINSRTLYLLTQQWASLLKAGLNVDASLVTLVGQADTPVQREILSSVRDEVRAGRTLASALAMHPRSFPTLYVALIRAGEAAGELAEVLSRLADYLADSEALRRKTMEAMIYPVLMVVVAIAVVAALLVFVVPQVVSVFEHQRQTLPWLTRALLWVSHAAKVGGLPALVVVALGVAWWRRAWRVEAFRRRVEVRLLAMPLIGKLLRSADTARFASTLAILVKSGVPLLVALEAGKALVERLPLRDIVDHALREVSAGKALSRALKRDNGFPPLLVNLISSGEHSGQLPDMLAQAARLEQMTLEHDVAVLTRLLEPLMILFMGGMVLAIVLAILQPIFSINQLLH